MTENKTLPATDALMPMTEIQVRQLQRCLLNAAEGPMTNPDLVGRRIAAETAAPYPPGIPALAPGERISATVLTALQAEAKGGTRIAYCGDPMLETVLVVKE